jgi:hypothetical protein
MNTLQLTIRKEIVTKVLFEPAKSSKQKLIDEIGKTVSLFLNIFRNKQ